ncbi:MAG: 30S ribosomal protein S27e [Candidatus Hodarchaeota archaeon]
MKEKDVLPNPRSRFLRVSCTECNSTQIIFGCASTAVKCRACGKQLTIPRGGKARIITKIEDVLT